MLCFTNLVTMCVLEILCILATFFPFTCGVVTDVHCTLLGLFLCNWVGAVNC